MTDAAYLGIGMVACAAAAAIQYGGWRRLGGVRATTGEIEARRRALRSWVIFAVVWQVALLAAVGVYVLIQSAAHPPQVAWPAPAVGAVVGTALPLQLVVIALMRAVGRP